MSPFRTLGRGQGGLGQGLSIIGKRGSDARVRDGVCQRFCYPGVPHHWSTMMLRLIEQHVYGLHDGPAATPTAIVRGWNATDGVTATGVDPSSEAALAKAAHLVRAKWAAEVDARGHCVIPDAALKAAMATPEMGSFDADATDALVAELQAKNIVEAVEAADGEQLVFKVRPQP